LNQPQSGNLNFTLPQTVLNGAEYQDQHQPGDYCPGDLKACGHDENRQRQAEEGSKLASGGAKWPVKIRPFPSTDNEGQQD
jgi:hypothetical protein